MSYAEADGPACTQWYGVRSAYGDAVGDLAQLADPNISAKWGPSLSLFQIRTLRHPEAYPFPDTLRVAAKIRDPRANAEAAFAISAGGTDWSKWSTFRSGTYLPYVGKNYLIKTGHPHAGDWSK